MKIKYIGNKATKTDNVAGTDTVWNGEGDVQEVKDPLACAKLLEYPNVWVTAEAVQPGAVATKKERAAAAVKGKRGQHEDEELPEIPIVDVNRLGKDRLQQFANTHLRGLKIDQRNPIGKIRDQVRNEIAKRSGAGARK